LELVLGREALVDLGDETPVLLVTEGVDHALDLGHLAIRHVAVGLQHQLEESDQREALFVVQVPQLHGRHPKPGSMAGVNPRPAQMC
jgi:hypothetical protein